MGLFLSVNAGFSLRNEVFEEKMRRIWGKRDPFGHDKKCVWGKQEKILEKTSDAFAKNKNRKCLQPAHVHYSFSARSAPHFYERTTSAERVMDVGTTRDELGEHKEKRWCETGSDEELKREGEVYM